MSLHLAAIGRFVGFALAGVLASPLVSAQSITIDGTLSPAKTLVGPNYTIGANLGKQVGSNLFQSFGLFGLVTGESANFTGPANVANIIGRVTGGSPSSIDGDIRSSIAGANLYLINPYGMVFGPNATVNVSGSFHAATADYIRMADGAAFQATHPGGSTFSAAPPAAFGFLGTTPAAIAVSGSSLAVDSGKTLGLVGGPVTITGATLTAPGGTIHIASAAAPGEVPVDPTQVATVTSFGPVAIGGGSKLDVTSGGSVFIRAGTLSIDASQIDADNTGTGPGGQLVMQADGPIALDDRAAISAIARGGGGGADIVISTGGQLTVTDGASVTSRTTGSAAGGAIAIAAGTVVLDGGPGFRRNTGIFSLASGSGNGGAIALSAGQLALHDLAAILATTTGKGAGGAIEVTAAGPLTLDSGASLGTTATASGAAGNVSVAAAGALTIDMSVEFSRSVLDGIGSATEGIGSAGAVTVSAAAAAITTNGAIGSTTYGAGKGGSVSVTVAGLLAIDGSAARFTTGITAETEGSGDAGSITVCAGQLSMANTGEITAGTFAAGNSGMISVLVTGLLSIDGYGNAAGATGVSSQTNRGSTGSAGSVSVSTGELLMVRGGEISSSTLAAGAGGSVSVTVSGLLSIDGSSAGFLTGITAGTEGSGDAGAVQVRAGTASITNTGVITSSTKGAGNGGSVAVAIAGLLSIDGSSGNFLTGVSAQTQRRGAAGSVTLSAGELSLVNGGQISSATLRSGVGGSVSVAVAGLLTIGESSGNPQLPAGITTQSLGRGDAGQIIVDAASLSILDGGVISSATAGPGNGGNVRVAAGTITLSGAGPRITAQSTGSGDAGAIEVAAGRLQILDGASISTAATSANGGDVSLAVGDLLYLRQGAVTTSVFTQSGNGGNIAIDAQEIVLAQGSEIVARAFRGHGGNIAIDADAFVPSTDSLVSAASQLGISGTVAISGEETGLNSSLVVLPSTLQNHAAIRRIACAARGARPQSSLVEGGRGGLPQDPGAILPAFYLVGRPPVPEAAFPSLAIPAAMLAASEAVVSRGRDCD